MTLPPGNAVTELTELVLRQLQEHRICTIFINSKGEIELALPGEIILDGLPPIQALQALLQKGYSDQELQHYMYGRTEREASLNATGCVKSAIQLNNEPTGG